MSSRMGLVAWLVVAIAAVGLGGEPKAAAEGPNELDALMGRLASTKLSVEVDKKNPDIVLDLIRDAAKVNIVVDPTVRKNWEAETVTLKLKEVSALSALHHIVRQLDTVAIYAEEALVITTPQAAQPHPQITVYDIHDITEGLRQFRQPPMLFGTQLDPLYYYASRAQLGPVTGTGNWQDPFYDPFGDLDLLERRPPDPIGQVIADTVEKQVGGRDLGISVTYRDGYLVVVQQPKAPRLPITKAEIEKAISGAAGK